MFCVPDFSVWNYYPDFSWSLFIKAVTLPPKTNYVFNIKIYLYEKKAFINSIVILFGFCKPQCAEWWKWEWERKWLWKWEWTPYS